ncbi:MAG TPA: AAA family ATPase [Chloroflexota bacterium]
MRLHVLTGDHAGARRVYQACVEVLRRELGEEPEGATREAYAVAQRDLEEPRPAGDQPSRWPLVGRQREWASLRKYFQAGNSGSRVLLIVGEAGVGKTRLIEELVEWRRAHGDLAAAAACYRGGVISYAPVAAWLRTPAVETARAGLRELWLGEVGRIVPEVLAERPDLTPRPITEDWQRQHLFEALARALVAPGQPMLVVLEDLHWCDQASLEFLGFFLRWRSPLRVVVCATARIEELNDQPGVGPLLEALRGEGRLDGLELAPLDPGETGQLAAHVVGRTLDAAAVEALYHETEGNALHVVETLRAGTLGPLPASVQAVIAARLGQLSPPARQLAGLAATIGREFRFPLLARAARNADEVVVSQLDELIQRRLVREHVDASYDFSHDKIRMVAYAQLSAARRRLLHARVAEAIEALEPDLDSVSSILAHHYEALGNSDRAVVLYQQAAEAARRVYANADAVAHTRRALALLGSLPVTRDAVAWRARTESVLQESLGDMLTMVRRHPEAIAAYQAARKWTAADDAIGRARLQRKEAAAHESQQDYPTALALLDQSEATLGPEPDVAEQAWWQEWIEVQNGRFMVHYWTANQEAMIDLTTTLGPVVERYGTPKQRVAQLAKLMNANTRRERYVPSDETLSIQRAALAASPPDLVGQRFGLGFVLLWRGELAEAEEHLMAAHAAAERIGDRLVLIRSTIYLATLCRFRGRSEATHDLANEALEYMAAAPIQEYVGAAQAHLAWSALRAGDVAAATDQARAALEAWRQTATVFAFEWMARWLLVDLALGRGDVEEAVGHAARMLDNTQQRLPDPHTAALDGAVQAWGSGSPASARRQLEVALDLARDTGHL